MISEFSPEIQSLLLTSAKTFLVALILTPITRDLFRAWDLVDKPDHRKVHTYPIPRVGGVPIAIAYTLALLSFTEPFPGYESLVWRLQPGITAVFLTGLLDDFFTLSPLVKLAGQIAGAVLVFFNGVRIETIAQIDLPIWLSFPLTVFWLLLATNALNLIDGLDGLCAGMGLLATLTLFGAAFMDGNFPLAFVMLPLVGALLGFLCYNFNPATVFLGDAGALSIGFLLGCCGMVWTQKTATLLGLAIPLLGLLIPLTDVSLSILRRFLRNQPIFSADRGHIHHRLLDRGLSPRRAVLVLYFAAGCSTLFALALITPRFAPFRGVIFLLVLAAAAFGVRQLQYTEFIAAGNMLFGGAFQRSVGATLEMDRLAQALAASSTEQSWWNVLAQVARDQHWRKLEWIRDGELRTRHSTPGETFWEFQIHLAPGESLCLAGGAVPDGFTPLNLNRLAEVVRANYFQPALAPQAVPAPGVSLT